MLRLACLGVRQSNSRGRSDPGQGTVGESRLRDILARDLERATDALASRRLTWWRVAVQLLEPETRLVVYFRVYAWMHARGWHWRAHIVHMWVRSRTNCEIAPTARIGPGLRIEHGSDLVIGATAVIGADVSIYNGVTLGKRRPPFDRMPTVGDRVVIGAGAKVLGGVVIGDDATVGANAVVLEDVEAGSSVGGVPARVVRRAAIEEHDVR